MGKTDLHNGLRELALAANSQATALLGRLFDAEVVMAPPNVASLEVGELGMYIAEDPANAVTLCQAYLAPGLKGEALLVLNSSPSQVAQLLKFDDHVDATVEAELVADIANIIVGAYLKGFGDQLDMSFSQGFPRILDRSATRADLADRRIPRQQRTLTIETSGRIDSPAASFDLLMLFSEDSVDTFDQLLAYLH